MSNELSHHEYRLLAESSPDLLSKHDLNGIFLYASPASQALLGIAPEQILTTNLLELIHPEDRPAMESALRSAASGVPETRICRFRSRDGNYVWLESTLRATRNQGVSGKTELLCISRDHSARTAVQHEEELEKQKKFLDNIINSLPITVFCKSVVNGHRYILWNRTAQRMWGFQSEQILDKTDYDLFPKEIADFFVEKDKETLRDRRVVEIHEEPIETRLSGRRYLHTYKIPLYDENGNPEFLIGIAEDITQRKEMESQLQIYRKVAEEMELGLHVYHLEKRGSPESLRIVIANRASGIITGIVPAAVLGKTAFEAFPNHPTAQLLHDLVVNHQSKDFGRVSYRHEHNTVEQHYLVRAFSMPGDLVGVLFENITERVNTEKALESERMVAISASRLASLGEMAAGLAHEINNPLAIISGKAQQIRRLLDADQVPRDLIKASAETIQRTVERVAQIIRGLRNFTREASNDPFTPTSLRTLIDDTLSFCMARFKSQGIQIDVCMPERDVAIHCRPAQISQVLLNLLNNAFDAVQSQSAPWVRLTIETADQGARIRVTDSGPGIPEHLRTKIMEPFFTTKEVGKGTGLGLSISRAIAEAHGGSLILNEAAANTEFELRLPSVPRS